MIEPFDPFTSPVGLIEDLLVIRASAGTGKTWMITHLAVRWLLEENHEPRELLMVTFSRSAASELKGRLRGRLEEVGELLEEIKRAGDAPVVEPRFNVPWARALFELSEKLGISELLDRHRRIYSLLDEVHARTIHSFASAVRQESELTLTSGTELARRAVHEVLTKRISANDPKLLQLLDELEGDSSSPTPAAKTLADRLTRALLTTEGAGGLRAGRVSFWRDEGSDTNVEQEVVAEGLLTDAFERLGELQAFERVTTYDGLINDLRDEVERDPLGVAHRLQDQFRLVLIDEFQDTDVAQWEIFDTVFRHGRRPTPVIVVGDPKQSIYAFRGGDVSVFLRVVDEARSPLNSRRCFELELNENYRSRSGLLESLDALFTHANSSAWHFASDGVDPVIYEHVEPCDRFVNDNGLFNVRRAASSTFDNAVVDDVVRVTRHLLDTHRAAARDVAILCARRGSLVKLRRALERAGVPTVSVGASSVFLSAAATQVRTLLWALLDVTDRRRVSAICTTWFAPIAASQWVSLATSLEHVGVSALARRVLGPEVLVLIRATADGERDWTDLEHLFELLAEHFSSPVPAERVLRYLDQCVGDARDGDADHEFAQRRVESDADAVRLMTIHGAKGLQFPVVLIPDIESVSPKRGVSSWTTPSGRAIDVATLLRSRPELPLGATRRREEARRLIYVALTRAESVLVSWLYGDKGEWPALFASAGDLLPPSWPLVQGIEIPFSVPDDVALIGSLPYEVTVPVLIGPAPQIDERSQRWSYSALNWHASGLNAIAISDSDGFDAAARAEDYDYDRDDLERYADVFGSLSGPSLGNAVHQWFEGAVGQIASSDYPRLSALANRAWADHGLELPNDTIIGTLSRLLSRPMGELFDGANLDDLMGSVRSAAEMRFTMPLGGVAAHSRLSALCALVARDDADGPYGEFFRSTAEATAHGHQLFGGYLTGSIDLVATVGTPQTERYVIVDYKTNLLKQVSTYEPNDLILEMGLSGYPLQGLLYAVALHRYLRARLTNYEPAQHLGGLCYYYVRGAARPNSPESGLANWHPPWHIVSAASDLLESSR